MYNVIYIMYNIRIIIIIMYNIILYNIAACWSLPNKNDEIS